ncbi:hypothetical protein D3C80_768960 [compost metagenome]
MACDIVVALSMRTESGDDYLFLYTDISSVDDFVERVVEGMGGELAYVYHVEVKTDCCADGTYSRALQEKIEEVQQLEDGEYD